MSHGQILHVIHYCYPTFGENNQESKKPKTKKPKERDVLDKHKRTEDNETASTINLPAIKLQQQNSITMQLHHVVHTVIEEPSTFQCFLFKSAECSFSLFTF